MKHQLHKVLFCSLLLLSGIDQCHAQGAIQDSLLSMMTDKEIPGMMVVVTNGDSVIHQFHMGLADVETQTPLGEESLFEIGSISKTFTSLAIMQLIEQGRLSLDDELKELAPEIEFDNPWEDTHPIRLKHLLEHKTGFDDMHFAAFASPRWEGMSAGDELAVQHGSLVSRWKPGMVSSYSNAGFVILGYIIEKETGEPYQAYIREHVLTALGMTATHYMSQSLSTDVSIVKGYNQVDGELQEILDPELVGEAAGGLLSSSADMIHFLQFLLRAKQDGPVALSSLKEMEQIHGEYELSNGIERGYGLGIYTREFGTRKVAFYGHNGGIEGFTSDYLYSPELDLGIAISNNAARWNGDMLDYLVDVLVPSSFEPASVLVEASTTDDWTDWEGCYQVMNMRNELFRALNYSAATLQLHVEGDSIVVTRFMGSEERFGSCGDHAFKGPGEASASLYFSEHDGERTLYFYDDLMLPASPVAFGALRATLFIGLVLGLAMLVLLVVRAIGRLFGRVDASTLRRTVVYVLPFIAIVLMFYLILSKASITEMKSLGLLSLTSISIFLLSCLYPLFALLSTVNLYRSWAGLKSKAWRAVYGLFALTNLSLTVYLLCFGWFAVRLWAG